jgi:phosphoglycolate phosphatase-like HAD superfamily hydrolase
MKKDIIFFDGDGILWYPKLSKWREVPHWVYKMYPEMDDYVQHLELTPALQQILTQLKEQGFILVALSTHPHKKFEADAHMKGKMRYFEIDAMFDAIYTARPVPEGKGKKMREILKRKGIPKSRAILIGDSYIYDYRSAKSVGIDCLLLQTPYLEHPPTGRRVQKLINQLKDLPKYLLGDELSDDSNAIKTY